MFKKLMYLFVCIVLLAVSQKLFAQSLNDKLMTEITFDESQKVEELINNGAQINFWNEYGETPLTRAAEKLSIASMKVLLKHGANVNIQEKGAGMTPLIMLAMSGDTPKAIEMAEILLKHGADPNIKNDADETALEIAACNGFLDFVKLLVKYGANVNVKNEFSGNSPLSCAQANNHNKVAAFLKAHGAHP